jgi:phosphoglycerate kinase
MNVKGKRVLVRIDGNVPVVGGKVQEGKFGKLERVAVDLEWLRQREARLIVMTHRGRPEGKWVSAYSVRPVARRLSELLGVKIALVHDLVGRTARHAVSRMKDGEVLMLENIRFDPREERNSPSLARALAALADLYVNDAFAVSHRAHTSIDAITSELPSYAGPLLANEVEVLSRVTKNPKKPLVLCLGGIKLETKLPVLRRFLRMAEHVVVGGAIATAFLKAEGHEVGHSVYDVDGVRTAAALLKKWRGKILLPVDVTVAGSFRANARERQTSVLEVNPQDIIVDVGKETIRRYAQELEKAKTIIWNGPFGYCEQERFCRTSLDLARVIASRTGRATTVVGGGDTVPMLENNRLVDRFSLLSTGGGAMLEFLAGKKLPGIEALEI